ncbi:uncharacterized protein RHO17_005693 isoform 2-T15 [Thomomys bottae]
MAQVSLLEAASGDHFLHCAHEVQTCSSAREHLQLGEGYTKFDSERQSSQGWGDTGQRETACIPCWLFWKILALREQRNEKGLRFQLEYELSMGPLICT